MGGVGQVGMPAAGRDMYTGAYGARPQVAYGGYGVQANGMGNRIVIENLPRTIMWQGLKDLFKRFGNVSRADVSTHPPPPPPIQTHRNRQRHIHTHTHMHTHSRSVMCLWIVMCDTCVLMRKSCRTGVFSTYVMYV